MDWTEESKKWEEELMIDESILHNSVIESELIPFLGECAWRRLHTKTKIDIITSETCLRAFMDYNGGFDFSSIIIPAMKGLEQELRINFYDGYIKYLESGKFSPEEYARRIWKGEYPGDREMSKKRSTILDYVGTSLCYKMDRTTFTVGDFRFTIGVTNLNHIRIDSTFDQYCRESLFKDYSYSYQDYLRWIQQLVTDIEPLRKLRNDSAHAGKILKRVDAETALNELIKVKKILGMIVCPKWIEQE